MGVAPSMARFTVPGVLAAAVGGTLVVWVMGGLVAPDRPEEAAALGPLADPVATYDPVRAGEPVPSGFRQALPRDAILPVYDPTFVPATASSWDEGTLVIGVALGGEARAYPVSYLNRREMVLDFVGDEPILVSW